MTHKTHTLHRDPLSLIIGGVIPDPTVLTTNKKKLARFSQDMMNMTKKQFGYTGDFEDL